MIVEELNLYRYSLPFKQTLRLSKIQLSSRQGFILEVITDEGFHGYGDVAPLPEFSQETLGAAQSALGRFRDFACGQELPGGLERLTGGFSRWLSELALPSAVRYGLEMAIVSCCLQKKKRSFGELNDAGAVDSVSVNAFLSGDDQQILVSARELLAGGYRSFKVKVGGRSLSDDITRVKALTSVLHGKALLRIDANRAWDFPEAVRFFQEVGLTVVEYIEEPLKDITRLGEFYQETLVPVALDESVREKGLDEFLATDGFEVLVLKPTLSGGLETSWALARQAQQKGLKIVVSSALESGLGILGLAHVAGCLCRHTAAGLDTVRYFVQDTLLDFLKIEKGRIDLRTCPLTAVRLRWDLLEKIVS